LTNVVDGSAESFGIETMNVVGDSRAAGLASRETLQSGIPLEFEKGLPVPPVETRARALQLRFKRLMDVALCLGAILVLAPPLLLVVLAIKLTSRGPVLYRQNRLGLDGAPFQLLKFRSMHVEHCDDGSRQATVGDSRLTMIGRFIRAKSIDELPQLWNVLIGDMSLVGPRPMVEGQLAAGRDYRELVPYYEFRLRMKPGLTGWAQANGLRGSTENASLATRRIDHDCAYIQNFSLWLDIRALLKTIRGEFFSGSGY
jgi:lipopolysaccharide/colanic/teichoic acid biosynthesis glycosyltransferase